NTPNIAENTYLEDSEPLDGSAGPDDQNMQMTTCFEECDETIAMAQTVRQNSSWIKRYSRSKFGQNGQTGSNWVNGSNLVKSGQTELTVKLGQRAGQLNRVEPEPIGFS